MEQVLERCRQQLLGEELPSASKIEGLLGALKPDGTWSDIKYEHDSPSQWPPRQHLLRLRDMAQAFGAPGHASHGAPKLKAGILLGIDHWLEKRYQCSNWWHNQIGVPQLMRDVVVLMGAEIDNPRRVGALEVIGQHQLRGSGANLVWSAELAFHLACMTGDTARAAATAERLWNEVKVGAPEGIQTDWSFYQHGPRLQSFHYGRSFFDVAGKVAWQLRGTPWEIPPAKREMLSNYLLEGQQWMVRGTYTVPGTMDRMVSRKNSLGMADLRTLLGLWKDVDPAREAEITAFVDRQSSSTAPQLDGFRAFPYGDFFVYHQPKFSFFLKTISTRTRATESINSENLKGVPYLHSGDHYLMREGDEYSNLQPVWEWDRLPGITIAPGLVRQVRRPFTGGVGNGRSGVAAMDYRRTGAAAESEAEESKDEAFLQTRKLWAFHEGMVVCLISDIETLGVSGEVVTALEQCRLAGPVVWKPEGGEGDYTMLPDETHETRRVAWALHNGVGYVPLSGTGPLTIDTRPRTGSWKSINAGYDDKPESAAVFSLRLVHDGGGAGSGDEGYAAEGYAIVGDTNEEALERIVAQPPWTVVRNDSKRQHLRFPDGTEMAAFYEPGEAGGNHSGIGVDAPCLALWNGQGLWICDPTHEGRTVTVTRGGDRVELTLPAGGVVVKHMMD